MGQQSEGHWQPEVPAPGPATIPRGEASATTSVQSHGQLGDQDSCHTTELDWGKARLISTLQ